MNAGTMALFFFLYVIGQGISMVVDWNTTMSTTSTATINSVLNPGAIASDPINFVTGLYKLVTWDYSFLQGDFAWIRLLGGCFTIIFIWAFIQLLVYAIGNIFGKIFK